MTRDAKPGVLRTTLTGTIVLAVATASGYFSSRHGLQVVLTPLLKFAIGIIGVAWFFSLTVYNKLSDVTDLAGLDFRQHRNIEIEIRARLQWFWLRAIFLGLLALMMYVPTILSEAHLTPPDWVIGTAVGAFALALFALRRLWSELEEIRELKSYVKELERREKERADQVKTLKEGVHGDWQHDPRLDSFRNNPSDN